MSVTSYLKRLSRSVKYAAIDVLKEQMPITDKMVQDNKETVKQTYESITDYKQHLGRLKTMRDQYLFKPLNDTMRNLKRDLRTGDFYREDPKQAAESEAELFEMLSKEMGFDLMGEINGLLAEAEGTSDEEGQANTPPGVKGDPTITKGDVVGASFVASHVKSGSIGISRAIVKSGNANIQALMQISNLQYAQSEKQISLLHSGFSSLSHGINALIEFNNKVMLKHVENATKYFDTMTNLTRENNAILKEMIDFQRFFYKRNLKKDDEDAATPDSNAPATKRSVFAGGFNLAEYKKLINQNIENNPMLQAARMAITMFPMMIQDIVQHPMQAITKNLISGLMGPQLKNSMRRFDNSINGIIETALAKLADYGNKPGGSPLGILGQLFGIKQGNVSLSAVDTSKYEKGPMAWNGIANKSLVEVIPAHLRRIEASLTGMPERLFDFTTGKWKSATTVKDLDKKLDARYANDALKDFKKEMYEMLAPIRFDNTDEGRKSKAELRKAVKNLALGIYKKGYVDFDDIQRAIDMGGNEKYGKNPELLRLLLTVMNNMDRINFVNVTGKIANAKRNKIDMIESQIENGTSGTVSQYLNNSTMGMVNADKSFYDSKTGKALQSPASLLTELKDERGLTLYDYQLKIYRELYGIRTILMNVPLGGGGGTGGEIPSPLGPSPLSGFNPNMIKGLKGNINLSSAKIIGGFDVFKNFEQDLKDFRTNKSEKYVPKTEKPNLNYHNREYVQYANQFRRRLTQREKMQARMNKLGYEWGTTENTFDIDKFQNDPEYREQFQKEFNQKINSHVAQYKKNELAKSDSIWSSLFNFIRPDADRLPEGVDPNADFFDQLIQAGTVGEKIGIIQNSIAKIASAPNAILTSVITRADDIMYDMLFGRENLKDENGKPIKGLFNRMIFEMEKTFKDLNSRLNILFGSAKSNLSKMWTFGKTAVKEALGFDVDESLENLKAQARARARGLTKGYVDAVKGKAKDVANQVTDAVKGTIEDVQSSTGLDIGVGSAKSKEQLYNRIKAYKQNNQEASTPNKEEQGYSSEYAGISFTPDKEQISHEEIFDQMGKYSRGARTVTKGGLAFISEGEAIIPADMNPFNPNRDTVDINAQARHEDYMRSSLVNQIKNAPGHAGGVSAVALHDYSGEPYQQQQQDKKSKPILPKRFINAAAKGTGIAGINEFMGAAFGLDAQRAAKEGNRFLKNNFGDIAGGGTLGAIASIVLPLGGPLMGAIYGATASILSNNETLQNYVFGKEVMIDGKRRRQGGLLPEKAVQIFEKYAPDAKKYGIVGGLAGLVLPFGPLGGAMLGAGVSIIKNNEIVKDFLFGDSEGLLNKNRKAFLKKNAPRLLTGAMGGALLGATSIGLLPALALGTGAGLLTTTETFGKIMLGVKDKDGKRRGGLAGAIRAEVIEPFKFWAKGFQREFSSWMKNQFLKPIGSGIHSMSRFMFNVITRSTRSILGGLVETLKKRGGFFFERLFNVFQLPRRIGGLLTGAGRWLGRNTLGRVAKGVERLGEKADAQMMKRGWASKDMGTASERLEVMQREGIDPNNAYYRLDQRLAQMGSQEERDRLLRRVQTMGDVLEASKNNNDRFRDIQENAFSNLMGVYQDSATKNIHINRDFIQKLGKYYMEDLYNGKKTTKEIVDEIANNNKIPSQEVKNQLIRIVTDASKEIDQAKEMRARIQGNDELDKEFLDVAKQIGIDTGIKDSDSDEVKKKKIEAAKEQFAEQYNKTTRYIKNEMSLQADRAAQESMVSEKEMSAEEKKVHEINEKREEEKTRALEYLMEVYKGTSTADAFLSKQSEYFSLSVYNAFKAIINKDKSIQAEYEKKNKQLADANEINALKASGKSKELGRKLGLTESEALRGIDEETTAKLLVGHKDLGPSADNKGQFVNGKYIGSEEGKGYNVKLNKEAERLLQTKADYEQTRAYIANVKTFIELDEPSKECIYHLTSVGYTIPENVYETIQQLSKTAKKLVMDLADIGGVTFSEFNKFLGIQDNKEGEYTAKLIYDLARSKIGGDGRDVKEAFTTGSMVSLVNDRKFRDKALNAGANKEGRNFSPGKVLDEETVEEYRSRLNQSTKTSVEQSKRGRQTQAKRNKEKELRRRKNMQTKINDVAGGIAVLDPSVNTDSIRMTPEEYNEAVRKTSTEYVENIPGHAFGTDFFSPIKNLFSSNSSGDKKQQSTSDQPVKQASAKTEDISSDAKNINAQAMVSPNAADAVNPLAHQSIQSDQSKNKNKKQQAITSVPTGEGDIVQYGVSASDGQPMKLHNKNNQEIEQKNKYKVALQERSTKALENIANKIGASAKDGLRDAANQGKDSLLDLLKGIFSPFIQIKDLLYAIPLLGPLLKKGVGAITGFFGKQLSRLKTAIGKQISDFFKPVTTALNKVKVQTIQKLGGLAASIIMGFRKTLLSAVSKVPGGKMALIAAGLLGAGAAAKQVLGDDSAVGLGAPTEVDDEGNPVTDEEGNEQSSGLFGNGLLGNIASIGSYVAGSKAAKLLGKTRLGKKLGLGGALGQNLMGSIASNAVDGTLDPLSIAMDAGMGYGMDKLGARIMGGKKNNITESPEDIVDDIQDSTKQETKTTTKTRRGKLSRKQRKAQILANRRNKATPTQNIQRVKEVATKPNIVPEKDQLLNQNKTAILGKIREGINGVISKIKFLLPGKKAVQAVEAFGAKLLKSCAKPEALARITSKLARQGAMAAGLATAGIMSAVMMVAGAVSDFQHGYYDADNILQVPEGSASTGMKIVCGVALALCGAIPILGAIIPDDMVLEMAIKFLGPAFGFGEKELNELRNKKKKQDSDDNKQQANPEQKKTMSENIVSNIINDAKNVGSSIIDKAVKSAHALTDMVSGGLNRAKQAGAALWESAKNAGKDAMSWLGDKASQAYNAIKSGASAVYNWGSEKVSDAANWVGEKVDSIGSSIKSVWNRMPWAGEGKHATPKFGMGGFYSQLDPAFAMPFNAPYDTEAQTMADSGCGPAAASNALSSLGIEVDPRVGAQYALSRGFKERDGGTKPDFFNSFMGDMGVKTSNLHTAGDIKESLKSGNPVILMGKDSAGESNRTPFAENPHYVTATGLDANGNIIVQDPESYTPNKKYSPSMLNKVTNAVSATGRGTSKSGKGLSAGFVKFMNNIKYGRGKARYGMGDYKDNMKTIYDYLTKKGLGTVAACAVIGNIGQESTFQTDAVSYDGNNSYGICQWTFERKTALHDFAKSKGKPVSDLGVQLDYLWHEFETTEAQAIADTIASEDDLDTATEVFCKSFERAGKPEMQNRLKFAHEAFDSFANGNKTKSTFKPSVTGVRGSKSGGSSGPASKSIIGAFANVASILSDAMNPFAGSSNSNGSSSSGYTGSGDTEKNQEIIWKYLKDKGLNDVQIGAIMGSMYQESRFDPGAVNPKSQAKGLAQWFDVRDDKLQEFAKKKGTDWRDINTQLDYLWTEIGPGGYYNGYLNDIKDMDVNKAADYWVDKFEVPGKGEEQYETRRKAAQDAIAKFSKTGKGKYGRGLFDPIGDWFEEQKNAWKRGYEKGPQGEDLSTNEAWSNSKLSAKEQQVKKDAEKKKATTTSTTSNTSSGSDYTGGFYDKLANMANKVASPFKSAMQKLGTSVLGKVSGKFGSALKMIYGDTNPFASIFGASEGSNGSSSSSGNNNSGSSTNIVGSPPQSGSATDAILKMMPGSSVTAPYGEVRSRASGGTYQHNGVDIGGNDEGTPIPSPIAGKVVDVGNEANGYGLYVQIQDSKGNYHLFAHMCEQTASNGTQINAGDQIGKVGSTGHSSGPHIHYTISDSSNPGAAGFSGTLDPSSYMIDGLAGSSTSGKGKHSKYGRSKYSDTSSIFHPEKFEAKKLYGDDVGFVLRKSNVRKPKKAYKKFISGKGTTDDIRDLYTSSTYDPSLAVTDMQNGYIDENGNYLQQNVTNKLQTIPVVNNTNRAVGTRNNIVSQPQNLNNDLGSKLDTLISLQKQNNEMISALVKFATAFSKISMSNSSNATQEQAVKDKSRDLMDQISSVMRGASIGNNGNVNALGSTDLNEFNTIIQSMESIASR